MLRFIKQEKALEISIREPNKSVSFMTNFYLKSLDVPRSAYRIVSFRLILFRWLVRFMSIRSVKSVAVDLHKKCSINHGFSSQAIHHAREPFAGEKNRFASISVSGLRAWQLPLSKIFSYKTISIWASLYFSKQENIFMLIKLHKLCEILI